VRVPSGRVFVVGSTNVDRTVSVPRLPGRGETVLGDAIRLSQGGKGANAAVAAALAGAEVAFISAVGADEDGQAATASLRAEGVEVGDVAVLDEAPTGTALIITDEEGANLIAVAAGANARLSGDHVARALGALRGDDVVLVSAEIPDPCIEAALRAAAEHGSAAILNPAPARPSLLGAAQLGAILTPNETEARELTGLEEADAAARRLAILSERPAVITLGEAGCLVADGDTVTPYPAAAAPAIVDTVGAGDAFGGGLAAALAAGRPFAQAVDAALRAAAESLGHAGARP
jgi:ribokinase